jgi:branched-chain amino acid transport system permease protein
VKLTWSRAALAAFVAALLAVPFGAPQFWVTLGNYIGLYSIVALGLVLLTGVAGQTSFGQAAFVGLGAYATAWLTTQHATSPWLTLFIGLAITAVIALGLGFITLRMKGHYLPLATIAWGSASSSCSATSSSSAATPGSPASRRCRSAGSS